MFKTCIIIDDPFLKASYGFLDFCKLLDLMDKHNFHTTIAFIPWNYRRTNKKTAKLFLDRPDRFSLCVHGCDHTRGEFGSTNEKPLEAISKLALYRMSEHQRGTGIPFAPVMVFPQGIFSGVALDILHRVGFKAAVNTELSSTDGRGPDSSMLPFYQRLKPEDIHIPADPCFVVLHHDFFRNGGYGRLATFVARLNEEGAEWDSVGNILGCPSIEPVTKPVSRIYSIPKTVKIFVRRISCDIRDNVVMPMGLKLGSEY